jgi:nicotinamide-nucleotide amidase
VLARLRARGETLAVAESLTGGGVCWALTAVPGASTVVLGGVVAYTDAAKVALLDVPVTLLAEHGAVSSPVALAMATGAWRRLAAHWAVATTGVAGPGPAQGVPAGTVHVAVVGVGAGDRDRGPQVRAVDSWHLTGDRHAVREASVRAALALIGRALVQR